ncbi:hypothetical protein [Massilia sp. BJB1822]|uniref:hypothetical protein n=1 Tax=Massilia sp. BJB1822 TaxID=2744470 RepID=UPI00159434E2|nr:hypothetical protein [Massilia sp. BJB1822]NVD97941.1 hypothetical protein [Massilia sp. BJB1822]
MWRSVDVSALGEQEGRRFGRMQRAIDAYIVTGQLTAISKEQDVAPEEIIRALNRCTALSPDGSIMGWAGLLKNERIDPYRREAELPTGRPGRARGYVGSFSAFLDAHPDFREKLDTLVLKRNKRGVVHEAKIAAKTVHATLVRLCDEAGLTRDDYPLNSKSQARRSVERYMADLIESNLAEGTRARFGADAVSRLRVGTGYPRRIQSIAPYDLVGLDAHKIDCIGTVRIPGPAGPQWVPMERLWIVPVLEFECRAILGYSVGIRTECSAGTIESALKSALMTWQPRQLRVPGMTYLPNAGLPSGVFPELSGCGWNTLSVDNAAAHFAKAIAERARRRIGCMVTYGAIGRWDHRGLLERLMQTLEKYGFQRLPSTTGTGPNDPRRDDPVRKAVAAKIEWEILFDIIDVLMANYNVTPNEALGNRAPLSVLREHLHGSPPTFLPRPLPPPTACQPDLGIVVERRTVRGNKKKGKRPYICIDRINYTNPLLGKSMALIGHGLLVHIDESDLRTVRAYFASGEELGVLLASGGWARTKHTREMRKLVNSLRSSGELLLHTGEDPIEALLAYVANAAYADAKKRPHKVSKSATKVARLAHDSGLPVPEASPVPPQEVPPQLSPATPSRLVKPPVWKTIVK